MAGERPERDVLAARGRRLNEFLASLPSSHDRTQALIDLNGLLQEVNDALRATLSKSAPDRPEPLPREALDDDGPVWTAGCPICAALAPEGSAGTEEWLGPEYAAVLSEGSARDGG